MDRLITRWHQLRQRFISLNTGDPADVRRAQLLKPILQAALVLMLLIGPLWVYFSPANERAIGTGLALSAILTTAAILPLVNQGRIRAASVTLPTAMLLIFTTAMVTMGGVRSPTASGLFVVVCLAHVLLGERGSLAFAALAIGAYFAVFLAEQAGLVAAWPAGAARAWVLLSGLLAFVAWLLSLTLQPMREGLADARRAQTRETERAHELDALLQAHGALVSTLELDPLLDNVLKAALAAIPAAEKGTVLLTNPPSEALQIRALHGYSDPRIQNLTFVTTQGYSARTLRDRRPWRVDDARADAEIRYEGDIPEVRAIRSAISAPLLLQQEPLGVITLDSTRLGAFTERDLRLLVAFANTAVLAIGNAHLHAQVQDLANRDGLTGAANRRRLDAALPFEVERARRYGHSVSLVFMDLDSFKEYNDTHGHMAGDDRLRALADLVSGLIRYPDMLARYGGEEFTLLLPHTGKAGALELAERVRSAAQGKADAKGGYVPGYTLSLGVATYPWDAETAEALLRAADEAELEAKRAGKNRVCAAPPLRTTPTRLELDQKFSAAWDLPERKQDHDEPTV